MVNDPPGEYGEVVPGNWSFGPPDPAAEFNLPTITAVNAGAGGVTVTLIGAGPDGLFGTADDTTATTTTGPDGSYSFVGLAAGSYRVTADLPADPAFPPFPEEAWVFSTCMAGIMPMGSEPWESQTWSYAPGGDTQERVLAPGDDVTAIDFTATNDLKEALRCE